MESFLFSSGNNLEDCEKLFSVGELFFVVVASDSNQLIDGWKKTLLFFNLDEFIFWHNNIYIYLCIQTFSVFFPVVKGWNGMRMIMISNKLPKSAEAVRGHNISKVRNINKNITLTCLGSIYK